MAEVEVPGKLFSHSFLYRVVLLGLHIFLYQGWSVGSTGIKTLVYQIVTLACYHRSKCIQTFNHTWIKDAHSFTVYTVTVFFKLKLIFLPRLLRTLYRLYEYLWKPLLNQIVLTKKLFPHSAWRICSHELGLKFIVAYKNQIIYVNSYLLSAYFFSKNQK